MNTVLLRTFLLPAALLAFQPAAWARVSAEQAAQLGGDKLTCMGAERAGSDTGVPAYSGKWLDSWPGMKSADGYDPGPYADEKPLFTITADNMPQYSDRLTDGQKALLKKYPNSFRMPVYTSHRDFRPADWVCDTVRKNALSAELLADGLGTSQALGAIPFPIPQSGIEALYNIKRGSGSWSQAAVHSIASVYANGSIAWGKVKLKVLVPWAKPGLNPRPTPKEEPIEAYFYHEQLMPERDKGTKSVGTTPVNYVNTQLLAWVYQPGTRRVRQAVEVPPDYPVPPAGMHTVDDESLFNGSPERFSWKLVGKKEIYIPYHNFRVNDPALKYSELIGPNTVNPDYERYELHRVWIIEGTLKSGIRHIYSRRVLYADEDTWAPCWGDNYDTRGQFWRSNFVNYFYSPRAQSFQRGVTVYHDLMNGTYEAEYLVNESGRDWWKFNDPSLTLATFNPNSLAGQGH